MPNEHKISEGHGSAERKKCMELSIAAQARGAGAEYVMESHMMKVCDKEWGPYMVSGEFIADLVDEFEPEWAWRILRNCEASADGRTLVISREELDRLKDRDRA